MACYEYLKCIKEMVAVHGNSDCTELKGSLPERTVFDAEEVRIGVVHEGQLSANIYFWHLARELGVDVLIVGHLHTPIAVGCTDYYVAYPLGLKGVVVATL